MWQLIGKDGKVYSTHRTKPAAERESFNVRNIGIFFLRVTGCTELELPAWIIDYRIELEKRLKIKSLIKSYKKGEL